MSEKNIISSKAVDLLVTEVLRKNKVDLNSAKTKLTEEQKQKIKEIVEQLTTEVNTFVNQTKKDS